ncbi:MAG: hypothetical protein ACR2PI_12575 [Hyphomicrobiaceae bacterium]
MVISKVSTDSAGNEAIGLGTRIAEDSVTADGRFVVFTSSNDLLAGDTNGGDDVFIKDTLTGALTLISTDSNGVQIAGRSSNASTSDDGRFVAFEVSPAATFVNGQAVAGPTARQVYLKDTLTGVLTLVSSDSNGAEGNLFSSNASISADGRFVVFVSLANNLVAGDTNSRQDIFLKDTLTGSTSRISVSGSGAEGDGAGIFPAISSDGRFVVFRSDSSNLVSGDTNDAYDLFVKDVQTGAIERISRDDGNTRSTGTSISVDGRYVTFESNADDLVAGDTNGETDIFVRDMQTGLVTRVSTNSNGDQSDGANFFGFGSPSISDDGRYVAFSSFADDLVPGDTNETNDIFIKDTLSGAIVRVSTDSDGNQGNAGSGSASISADGRHVVFGSNATNLTDGESISVPSLPEQEIYLATNPLALANDIAKLYIAYFDRAPESDGLQFHIDAATGDMAAGRSFADALARRADQFFDAAVAADFSDYSLDQPVAAFLEMIYTNVLLRPGPGGAAPNADEIGYWQDRLASGDLTRGEIVIEFLAAVDILKTMGTPSEQAVADQVDQVLQNRLTVGLAFSNEENSGGLVGEAAYNAGRAALVGIDASQASVDAALALLAASVSQKLDGDLAVAFAVSPTNIDDVTVDAVGLAPQSFSDSGELG